MKEGIPNYTCPADLFDRLIIERLKVAQLEGMDLDPDTKESRIVNTERCIGLLKDEIKTKLATVQGDLSELVDLFDRLIIAVSMVSRCENYKADLHKVEPTDHVAISATDRVSRAANEDRSAIKNEINRLFGRLTGDTSLVEQRTF